MVTRTKHGFFARNGLSVVLIAMLLLCLAGQSYTGWQVNNDGRTDKGQPPLSFAAYLDDPHLLSATFENWESEFLQMTMYILLTVRLYQVGSSESKDPEAEEEVDREPRPAPDAPWPVRRGGWVLALYRNSLSIAFFLLFALSFLLHLKGSYGVYRNEQVHKGLPVETLGHYVLGHQFWFESFQNWQSEFMAVASIVILSIWLRQKGSPESKPVDAPYHSTGG
jgi:hypothetical protein